MEAEEKERWKRVVGYNDYVISSKGRVYSLKSRKLMTQHKHKGYLRVGLFKDGCQRNKRVHILVAIVFKQRLEGQNEVNHLDLDKANNNDWNLEWSTRLDNFNHAYENGAIKRGLEHGRCKLTKEQIYEIREDKRKASEVGKIME